MRSVSVPFCSSSASSSFRASSPRKSARWLSNKGLAKGRRSHPGHALRHRRPHRRGNRHRRRRSLHQAQAPPRRFPDLRSPTRPLSGPRTNISKDCRKPAISRKSKREPAKIAMRKTVMNHKIRADHNGNDAPGCLNRTRIYSLAPALSAYREAEIIRVPH